MEISSISKGQTCLSIMKNGEPNLMAISKSPNADSYINSALVINYKFAKILFNDANMEVCGIFASDMFELEPTWKFMDIVNFWRFVKEKGLRPYGKITLVQLHEWRGLYNEEIAISRELFHKGLKSSMDKPNQQDTMKRLGVNDNAISLGRMADAISAENEEKRLKQKPLTDEQISKKHNDFWNNNNK
jgi:hypothetical protein